MLKNLLSEHAAAKKLLVWDSTTGIGFLPVTESASEVYNKEYFEKYEGYAQTEMGEAITKFRAEFVRKHHKGSVIDVGIGSGAFVSAHGNAHGFDVNPVAIQWLKERNMWADPLTCSPRPVALTFWDSLEHILNAADYVMSATTWVFMSIPIFDGRKHVLKSKHFRPDEHYWYWSYKGITAWMGTLGFGVVSYSLKEVELGRDGIMTFAFKRIFN